MSSPSKSIAKSFILSIVKNFFPFFFFFCIIGSCALVQFVSVNKMEIHICFELDIKCLKGDLERK